MEPHKIVERLMLSNLPYTGVYKSTDPRVTYIVDYLLAKLDEEPFHPDKTMTREADNSTPCNKFQKEWEHVLMNLDLDRGGGGDILYDIRIMKLKFLIHEHMLPFMLMSTYDNAIYSHYNEICPSKTDNYYLKRIKMLLQYYWDELRFSLLRTLDYCVGSQCHTEITGIQREGAYVDSIIFNLTALSHEMRNVYPFLFPNEKTLRKQVHKK
jgi:hypothetical protein